MKTKTKLSKTFFGIGLFFLNSLLGLAFFSCNTDPEVELHVSVSVPDSLADTSKVAQITINLLDAQGALLKSNVYQGPVPQDPEHKLRGLNLGVDVPPSYILQIQGYKNGVKIITVQALITPTQKGTWYEAFPEPTAIHIEPRSLVLAVGDPSKALTIKPEPIFADPKVTWYVSDLSVASVSPSGLVSPLKAGQIWIKAISMVKPSVLDSISVQILAEGTVPIETTLVNKVPTGVVANPKQIKLAIAGGDKTLSATVLPLGAPEAVLWKSLNDTVAQVTQGGIVSPIALGDAKIVVQVASNALLTDTVLVSVVIPQTVTSLKFNRPLPVLFTGAAPIALGLTHLPTTSIPILNWVSNDTGVAQFLADGKIKANQPGTAQIQVSAVGSNGVGDTATVIVKKDIPQIDAGKDQDIALGGTASFVIRVTQEFGIIQELSWDLNGDGTVEGTSTKDSVTTTFVYSAAGTFTAIFKVKDGEGNSNTLTRRIRVGSLAPKIEITKPLQHVYVNIPTFVVEYLVDNVPKTQSFTLVEGANNLFVKASNADGSDSVSVKVTLDTKAPAVKIQSPLANYTTNKSVIPVSWTVDSVLQTTGTSEIPTIGNGPWTIRRTFTDSAGNVGKDSILIVVDTVPPSPPAFVGLDTTVGNNRPTWTWNSGAGGNGTFTLQLGSGVEQETQLKSYQPATILQDGPNVLRIRERDAAGNWSSWVSKIITVKTTGPGAPSFVDATTTVSPTNNPKPTWTWTSGTGGNGVFRWSLSNTTPPVSGEGTTKSYTPASNLADGSYIMTLSEGDGLGNWSAPVTREIVIQTSGPLAPKVTGSATLTKSTPTWSWTGTGRVGAKFRVRLYKAGGATSIDSTETTTLSYAPVATLFANSDDVVYTVKVKEQDALGNWGGDGSADVRVDNVAPAQPTFSAQPASPLLAGDTRTSLAWTWSRTGAVADSFIVTINGTQVIRQTATTYTVTPIPDGNYSITVVEVDQATNASSVLTSATVAVDKSAPNAPTGVTTTSPTVSATPTFTWTSGGGGNGNYRVKLDNNNLSTGATLVSSAQFISTALSEGNHSLYVQERDAAGNWSATSAAGTVLVDLNAPSVSKPANQTLTSSTSATVSFTANDGSGSGVKGAVCKWGSSSSSTATLSGGNWSCSITNLPKGATAVTLEATDNVNKVGTNSLTITVNIPIPQIALNSKYQHFPTNQSSIKVSYTLDGAAKDTTFNLNQGANPFTIWGSANALGEKDSESGTIYRLSKVVFAATTKRGNGSGTDWDNASDNPALFATTSSYSGFEVWLSSGNYSSLRLEPTNAISYFGGFDLNSYPSDKNFRNSTNTTILEIFQQSNTLTVLDQISFSSAYIQYGNLTLQDCTLKNPTAVQTTYGLTAFDGGILTANNITIDNQTFPWAGLITIHVQAFGIFTNGVIKNNKFTELSGWEHPIVINGTATFNGTTIVSNQSSDSYQIYNAGTTTIRSSNIDCGTVDPSGGGTLNCSN
jgi:PKD domain/Bacterial Ig-like domain (group 2)